MSRLDNQQCDEALIEKRAIDHRKACERTIACGNQAFASLDRMTKKFPTVCASEHSLINYLHCLDVAGTCGGDIDCDMISGRYRHF